MISHRFVSFVFFCLWQNYSISSCDIVQVVLLRQEDSSRGVPLQNDTEHGLNLNFSIVAGQGMSYEERLEKFCRIFKSTGVSVIISQDTSSHPQLIDVYASYMGIPVMKLFHSSCEKQVVMQEQSTILHLDSDPNKRLVVITEILKKYNRNNRVIVVSHEKESNKALKLITMLRASSNSINSVFLNLTITKQDAKYFETLGVILALNITAVVLSMEQNLALDFMNASQQFGFTNIDCIWILEHSLDDNKSREIPLLGKLLGISLSQHHFSNKSLSRREALLKDSINILEKAFQNIGNTEFLTSSPNKDCRSSNCWFLRTKLFRAIKFVQVEGNTGKIEFDDQGYRTNVAYDIDYWYKNENSSTIKMLLAQYQDNKMTIYHKGWPPKIQLDILESKLAGNVPLRVSVRPQEPYVVINKKSAQNNSDVTCALGWPCLELDGKYSCCTGYCIDLLKLLMRDMGFSVIIQVVKDEKYGALNYTTGEWSGLIGEVVRGEADIAVSDLTINEQRSKVVDFTHPYLDAGMGVLVKVSHRDKNNWTGFMDPFAASLWIALVICVNIALFIMWLLERYSPYGQWERGKVFRDNKEHSFEVVQTIWFTWSLVFQTFDVGTKPKSFACRILALAFAFSMLIVITSYTANLAAFLVVEEEILPLNDAGIRDLKLQNPPVGFTIATIQDTSFERFFQATDDPVLRRVWQHMKQNSVQDFAEAVEQLDSGKLEAFVADYPTLENFAAKSQNCLFKIVGKSFFRSGFGLAVRKNSSLAWKISQVLRQYEDYDISRTLRHRWFLGQCSAMNSDENAMFARLSVRDLSGLFLAICFGVIISLFFFTVEYIKKTMRRSSYIFRNN